MLKKTSKILGLAIATILTTYISALTLSSQAFAQEIPTVTKHNQQDDPSIFSGTHSLGNVLAGQESQQVGKVLSGLNREIGGLFSSSFNPENGGDQFVSVLGGGLLGHTGLTNGGTGSGSTLGDTGCFGHVNNSMLGECRVDSQQH